MNTKKKPTTTTKAKAKAKSKAKAVGWNRMAAVNATILVATGAVRRTQEIAEAVNLVPTIEAIASNAGKILKLLSGADVAADAIASAYQSIILAGEWIDYSLNAKTITPDMEHARRAVLHLLGLPGWSYFVPGYGIVERPRSKKEKDISGQRHAQQILKYLFREETVGKVLAYYTNLDDDAEPEFLTYRQIRDLAAPEGGGSGKRKSGNSGEPEPVPSEFTEKVNGWIDILEKAKSNPEPEFLRAAVDCVIAELTEFVEG